MEGVGRAVAGGAVSLCWCMLHICVKLPPEQLNLGFH